MHQTGKQAFQAIVVEASSTHHCGGVVLVRAEVAKPIRIAIHMSQPGTQWLAPSE